MAQLKNRLTAKKVKDAKGPALLNDGVGLYLQVTPAGSKSWLFRYRWQKKRPQLGLGSYPTVSLADARRKAEEARGYLNERPKRNPREVWSRQSQMGNAQTFGEFTENFLARILESFRNEKHKYQWEQSLNSYAKPIWALPLEEIDTVAILECLQPIWIEKHETAKRLRGRLERILDAAKAEGLREGENPARWRGHLQAILPEPKRVVEHYAAIPYEKIPSFIEDLMDTSAISALALRFIVLTGARSSEGRGALWSEIDLEKQLWTLPPERMKGFRKHVVPLSGPALEVLSVAAAYRQSEFVFPGQLASKPISETSLRKLIRVRYPQKLDGRWPTIHGLRSTFRDWAGDKTSFSREVAELSIAHVAGDALERAYRRGDALDKRRALMDAWGAYCTDAAADVVKLHG